MSYDLAVWHTPTNLTNEQAGRIHAHLCESHPGVVRPHPAVDAFYAELTARYPETVPDDRIDDFDYSPWSCGLDRSPGHVLMACVWSQAENVHRFVWDLAAKHRLVLFDPQDGRVHHPGG